MGTAVPPMASRPDAAHSHAPPLPPPPPPCPPPAAPSAAYRRQSQGSFGSSKTASKPAPPSPGLIKSFFSSLFGKAPEVAAQGATKGKGDASDDDDDDYFSDFVESELSTNNQHRILQSFKLTKAMVPTRSVLKKPQGASSAAYDDEDSAHQRDHADRLPSIAMLATHDAVSGFSRDSLPVDEQRAFLRTSRSTNELTRTKSQKRVVCVLPDEMSPEEYAALNPKPLYRANTLPSNASLAPESPARASRLSSAAYASAPLDSSVITGGAPNALVNGLLLNNKGPNSPPRLEAASPRRTPVPLLHTQRSYNRRDSSLSYVPNAEDLLASASSPCVASPDLYLRPSSDLPGRPSCPQLPELVEEGSLRGAGHSWPLAGRRDVPPSPLLRGPGGGYSCGPVPEEVDLDAFLRTSENKGDNPFANDGTSGRRSSIVSNRYVSIAFQSISGRFSEPGQDLEPSTSAAAAAAGGGPPQHGRRSVHAELQPQHSRGHRQSMDFDMEEEEYFAPRSHATSAAPYSPAIAHHGAAPYSPASMHHGGAPTAAWEAAVASGLIKRPDLGSQVGMRL